MLFYGGLGLGCTHMHQNVIIISHFIK
jgi:hypothetical protein